MGGPDAREGRTPAAGRRVRRALLLAALAGGVLCTAYALYDGWRHADRVQRSLGLALPGWLVLVGVFGLVQIAAIGSVLRRPECGLAPLRWGLVAGARADALVVDAREAALLGLPGELALDALVFSGPARPWRDVMVAGRWAIRGGVHPRAEAIAARFAAAMHALG